MKVWRTATTVMATAVMVVALTSGGCGKKSADGGAAASGSASGTASGGGSAAPAPAQPPAARAKEAIATAAAVVQAMTDAIGKDRCGSADRVHAAVVASADKLAQVKAAFADPAVLAEVVKDLKAPPMGAAMSAWMQTMAEGDCKVHEDKDTLLAMLQPAVDAAQKVPAAPPAPPPTPPAGGSMAASLPRGGELAECTQLYALAQRVDACAAMPPNQKQGLLDMAKQNLDATDRHIPDGVKDYARSKCSGTADVLTQWLGRYGCK